MSKKFNDFNNLNDAPSASNSEFDRGERDFLDNILDGQPFMMVMTPATRRRLERRRIERSFEQAIDRRRIAARYGFIF